MALILISESSFPAYLALSTDITSGSTIEGASLIGKTVFTTDDGAWYIVSGSELILTPFVLPALAT